MSLLKNLSTDESIANEKDSIGSSGVIDSGCYLAKIAIAYITKATSGALGLVLHLKTEAGKEVRQTLWMTSGTAKGGHNYYTDKEGAKHYLPGFNHANSLALLTLGKEINSLDTETKVVNVWSSEAKAEVPTKVEMITDLLGKEIIVGVIKQTVDKTVKNDAGAYVPTGETREENEIDKFFRARDKMTTAEILAQTEEAVFINTWKDKWVGKVKDKTSKQAGTAGAPKAGTAPAGGTAKPTNSLFG